MDPLDFLSSAKDNAHPFIELPRKKRDHSNHSKCCFSMIEDNRQFHDESDNPNWDFCHFWLTLVRIHDSVSTVVAKDFK